MKKLIALLLAVSALSVSSSALADSYDSFELYPIGSSVGEHNGVSRNYTTSSYDAAGNPNYGSGAFGAVGAASNTLPTYRSGDLLTFALQSLNGGSPVKVNEGDVLTFICSFMDGDDYTNGTVQFVDQITLSPSDDSTACYFTYKLREGMTNGLYKMEMRLNGISNTFSFLIGAPSVELLYATQVPDGTTPDKTHVFKFDSNTKTAQCFGKVTITDGVNFSQTGTEFGFINTRTNEKWTVGTIRNGNELDGQAQAVADASNSHNSGNSNSYIGGQAQYFYRMIIENVQMVQQLDMVNVYIND